MPEQCTHLDDLLKAEGGVIKRHLIEHKYFRHISEDDAAISNFIENYGWLMREFYCGYVCEDKEQCGIALKYNYGGIKNGRQKSSN